MELLKDNYADGKVSTDTEKGVLSEADLAAILDRSVLLKGHKAAQKAAKAAAAGGGVGGSTAFKVVEQAENDGLLDVF